MCANPPVAATLAGLGGVWVVESPAPAFIADSILSRTDAPVSTPPDLLMSANARLMAAAPELLEAAKLVLEWYEAEDNHSGTDFYQRMQMCRDSEDAIRAAIAKACKAQQQVFH